jgi:prepilin-type N-terminal cleavage/methylation domain-containing protein
MRRQQIRSVISRRVADESGFTMIEILLVMVLGLVVFSASMFF